MHWYKTSIYARLVVRRAVLGILTLFLVSLIVFFATQLLPGDTARAVLGRSATPERLEALRAQLHLDEPALVQFGRWAGGLVSGDPGKSLVNGKPVAELIGPRISNSLVLLALVVAANSWLLDPHRLGAGSQLAQLRGGKTEAEKFDLAYLRFDAGRRGYQTLQSLKADPRFAASAPKARANLERALAATGSWEYRSELPEPPKSKTLEQTLRKLRRADGLAAIDPAWIEAALADRLRLPNCQDENANCVLASPDLDNDGRAEYLLCRIDEWGANCNAYALLPRGWRDIGQSYLSQRGSEAEAVLRANKVEVVPRRWGDIRVGAGNDAVRLENPARRYCENGERDEDCEPRGAKSAQR